MIRSLTAVALVLSLTGCGGPRPPEAPAPRSSPSASRAPGHPLALLSHDETEAALQILRAAGRFPEGVRLLSLSLREPPKEEVRAFVPGKPFRREVAVVILDHPHGEVSEGVVDLVTRKVASWKPVPGMKPWQLWNELDALTAAVRADPRWQEAMRKRGITDWSKVEIDPWTPSLISAEADGTRPIRVLSWYAGGERGVVHTRPIEGVTVIVDEKSLKIVRVVDTGVRRVAPHLYDVARASDPARRAPSASVPAAPSSIQIDGNAVRWRGWSFRVSLQPREGLVLHSIAIEDEGTPRSLLHRASISELFVPYADPDPNWAWRSAFDFGDEGGDILSLEPGRDVPLGARSVATTVADPSGKLTDIPHAISIYERDAGLLWKHQDELTGEDMVRTGHELVVKSFLLFNNYAYGFSWIFSEDGSISMQVEVTGMLLTKGVDRTFCGTCQEASAAPAAPSADEKFGKLVDQGIVAPNHQHFLNARLDFDIDGEANSIAEMEAHVAPEAEGSLTGNAWVYDERVLRDEGEAQREVSPATNRTWRVFNPRSRSSLGHFRGYLLVPGEPVYPYMAPQARARRLAGFIEKQLAVTRFRPDEMRAAGPYPNQLTQSGIPEFGANREPLVGEDLVVWHTFGINHHPRPEDWPIMPITRVGFKLLPVAFFARNPAFNTPR